MRDEELQNSDMWDYDSAERRPGSPRGRVVVSVAFHRGDFNRVAVCAEQTGKRTSEFIREAALEKARRHRELMSVSAFSGSLGSAVFTERPLPSTRGPATAMTREQPLATTI